MCDERDPPNVMLRKSPRVSLISTHTTKGVSGTRITCKSVLYMTNRSRGAGSLQIPNAFKPFQRCANTYISTWKMNFTTFHNVVDGKLRAAGSTYHSTNPVDETSLWPCPIATEDDIELAVLAAQKAQPEWAQKSYKERNQLLKSFADIYLSHADEFCQLLAAECGRTVSQIGTRCGNFGCCRLD